MQIYGGTLKVAVKVFGENRSRASEGIRCHAAVAVRALDSYNLARQELDILIHISHPHILRLLGVGFKPLALLLEYAEKGNLQEILKVFKKAEVRLGVATVQQVLSQVCGVSVMLCWCCVKRFVTI